MVTPNLESLAEELGRKVVIFDQAKHRDDPNYNWIAEGSPILLKKLVESDEAVGYVDMGEGLDILYDNKIGWQSAKHGVFNGDFVFVTDFYGFPEGGLFKRIK